jgi:hypothetical protein
MIPYYYLEPNSILDINLLEDNIQGKYSISKISFNLSNNYTMTISCSEIVEEY